MDSRADELGCEPASQHRCQCESSSGVVVACYSRAWAPAGCTCDDVARPDTDDAGTDPSAADGGDETDAAGSDSTAGG